MRRKRCGGRVTQSELNIKSEINKMLLLATTKNRNALWSHLNDGEAYESFHKAFESSVSLIQHGYHGKLKKNIWGHLTGWQLDKMCRLDKQERDKHYQVTTFFLI